MLRGMCPHCGSFVGTEEAAKIYELFTREVAEGDCLYADGCPTGARHYKCDPCRAREIIKATLAV